MRGQRLGLFAAAPEDERVPTLEPDHPFARLGETDEHRINVGLAVWVATQARAREHEFDLRSRLVEQRFVHQPVVDHDIGGPEHFQTLHRDKAWVAGTRANEVHLPRSHERPAKISAAPRSERRLASARPTPSGSARPPRASARTSLAPPSDTTPYMFITSPSTRA